MCVRALVIVSFLFAHSCYCTENIGCGKVKLKRDIARISSKAVIYNQVSLQFQTPPMSSNQDLSLLLCTHSRMSNCLYSLPE